MKLSIPAIFLLGSGFFATEYSVADQPPKPPTGMDCSQRSGDCGQPFRIVAKSTQLHQTPEAAGKKVAQLRKGNTVWLLGQVRKLDNIGGLHSFWYQVIDKNSRIGYVFGADLERTIPYLMDENQEHSINVGNLKLRRLPHKNAKSIDILQQGDKVSKLDESLILDYYVGDFMMPYAKVRTSTGKYGWVPTGALSSSTYYKTQCINFKQSFNSLSSGCVGTGCNGCDHMAAFFEEAGEFRLVFSCESHTLIGNWKRQGNKILAVVEDEQNQTQDCENECLLKEGPMYPDADPKKCREKCSTNANSYYGREIYKAKYEYEFAPALNNSVQMTLKSTDLNRIKGKAKYLLHQSVKDQDIGCMQPLKPNEK